MINGSLAGRLPSTGEMFRAGCQRLLPGCVDFCVIAVLVLRRTYQLNQNAIMSTPKQG